MKKAYIFIATVAIVINGLAQSTGPIENYIVEVVTVPYDTFSSDRSLYLDKLLNGFPPNDLYEFPFTFPFDNVNYSQYEFDFDGIVSFPGAADFQLFLFSGSYEVDQRQFQNGQIPSFLLSDYRYAEFLSPIPHVKIELRNIYSADDVFNGNYTASLSMTYSFYENGVIEIHFGDNTVSSASTNSWIDDFGWTFLPGDTTGLYGPYLSAASLDIQRGLCLSGKLNSFTVDRLDPDSCDPITEFPSSGTLLRFIPPSVSSLEDVVQTYQIYNDRPGKLLSIDEAAGDYGVTLSIVDFTGRVLALSNSKTISYANVNSGIYVVNVISPYLRESQVFVID